MKTNLKRYMISFVQGGEGQYTMLDSQAEVENFIKNFVRLNVKDPNSLIMNVTDLKTGKEIIGEVYPYGET